MSNEVGHHHCVIPIDFKSTRSLADFKVAVLKWCEIGTVKELKRKKASELQDPAESVCTSLKYYKQSEVLQSKAAGLLLGF